MSLVDETHTIVMPDTPMGNGTSYTGELILCEGVVPQARDEHISQANIEEVCYYLDDP